MNAGYKSVRRDGKTASRKPGEERRVVLQPKRAGVNRQRRKVFRNEGDLAKAHGVTPQKIRESPLTPTLSPWERGQGVPAVRASPLPIRIRLRMRTF